MLHRLKVLNLSKLGLVKKGRENRYWRLGSN